MFITILKNSHKNSFALMDTKRNCFGIHVSDNHDLIKVYQWANDATSIKRPWVFTAPAVNKLMSAITIIFSKCTNIHAF